MKKFFITLLVLAGFAAVCVITCPNKQEHKDALMSVVNSKLNHEMNKLSKDDGIVLFGSAVGSKLIEMALDSKLEVKNCFVCSIGQVETEDGVNTVSVGILGHVFTTSKEEFNKAFDENNVK